MEANTVITSLKNYEVRRRLKIIYVTFSGILAATLLPPGRPPPPQRSLSNGLEPQCSVNLCRWTPCQCNIYYFWDFFNNYATQISNSNQFFQPRLLCYMKNRVLRDKVNTSYAYTVLQFWQIDACAYLKNPLVVFMLTELKAIFNQCFPSFLFFLPTL